MVTGREVAYGMADIIASHNLMKYGSDSDDERLRMIAGGTLAGLGFAFGPELADRLKEIRSEGMSEQLQKQVLYAAGGATLGGVMTYLLGQDGPIAGCAGIVGDAVGDDNPVNRVIRQIDPDEKPGGMLTIASVGWLGYSLFFHPKTDEEKQRQFWGLGAGTIGYLYGPKFLQRLECVVVPAVARDTALGVHDTGAATFGMLIGAGVGWHMGGKQS